MRSSFLEGTYQLITDHLSRSDAYGITTCSFYKPQTILYSFYHLQFSQPHPLLQHIGNQYPQVISHCIPGDSDCEPGKYHLPVL